MKKLLELSSKPTHHTSQSFESHLHQLVSTTLGLILWRHHITMVDF